MQENVGNPNVSLCPNCFSPLNSRGYCSSCRYNVFEGHEQNPNALPSGVILRGRYYLGNPLGQGGFGITYRAYDLRLGARLAIKEFFPNGVAKRASETSSVVCSYQYVADFKGGLQKFLEEARTLARFSELPNIVSVKDYFAENGTAYMVMEYIDGITLLQYLKENDNKIPFAEAYSFLSPVMDVLNVVHAFGFVHRDISTDNIIVRHEGGVKLLDFGASESVGTLMHRSRNIFVLKKGYSPPEQYVENGMIGPWSDVYSMGATFYRCLTGELPQDARERLNDDRLKPLYAYDYSLTSQAEAAIRKAMNLFPTTRFQNMEDFKRAFNYSSAVYYIQNNEVATGLQSETGEQKEMSQNTPQRPAMWQPEHEKYEVGNSDINIAGYIVLSIVGIILWCCVLKDIFGIDLEYIFAWIKYIISYLFWYMRYTVFS